MAPNKNGKFESRNAQHAYENVNTFIIINYHVFAHAHAHWKSLCASDRSLSPAQNLCKWARKTFRAPFLSASNHSFTHLYIHKSLFSPWKVSLDRARRPTRERIFSGCKRQLWLFRSGATAIRSPTGKSRRLRRAEKQQQRTAEKLNNFRCYLKFKCVAMWPWRLWISCLSDASPIQQCGRFELRVHTKCGRGRLRQQNKTIHNVHKCIRR